MSGYSVAVIGIGAMGAPIARRVSDAGFNLTVCDKNMTALAAFADTGVRVTEKPSDCADSDVIVVLVATAEQMRDAVFGESGIVSGTRPGQHPVVVIMSTVSRDAVIDVQSRLDSYGISIIDAPVSGGPPRAKDGTLSVLVGGDAADIDSVREFLECVGARIFHCGPVGSAQVVKIVNNMICAANVAITGEAYRLALANGIEMADFVPILDVSSGRNFLSASPDDAEAYFTGWSSSREVYNSTLAIVAKDVGLAADLAETAPGSYPALGALQQVVGRLGSATFEHWQAVAAAGH